LAIISGPYVKQAVAFLKKSDAKNFLNRGYGRSSGNAPEESKVFCFLRPDDGAAQPRKSESGCQTWLKKAAFA
jgi:hypothetical protein